jgi:hypothetical protein
VCECAWQVRCFSYSAVETGWSMARWYRWAVSRGGPSCEFRGRIRLVRFARDTGLDIPLNFLQLIGPRR